MTLPREAGPLLTWESSGRAEIRSELSRRSIPSRSPSVACFFLSPAFIGTVHYRRQVRFEEKLTSLATDITFCWNIFDDGLIAIRL